MAPEVTVIIVNYNGGRLLSQCLEALKAQTFAAFCAVIADNGSTDGSFDAIVRSFSDPRFVFERLGHNYGFSVANNRVAATVHTPWIALLNPDAFPSPTWLAELMAATLRHGHADFFGSTQIDALRPEYLDGCGDCYFAWGFPWRGGYGHLLSVLPPEGEAFAPCGAAALYRTSRFKALGGFYEPLFCYCEDVDLGFRHRLAGGTCVQVASAVVRHVGGASSTQSSFARWHGARNQFWVFVKNMPLPLLVPLLPGHLFILAYLLFRMALRGEAVPVWRGFVAGIKGIGPVLRDRAKVQRTRTVSLAELTRSFSWSPLPIRRHHPAPLSGAGLSRR